MANVPLATRATLGNMSPEYGSTAAIFPVDDETLSYLRLTGRSTHQIALVEAYAKTQGLWHDPDHEPEFSQVVELDLATVEPSIAGPKRPQDRIPLSVAKRAVRGLLAGQSLTDAGSRVVSTTPRPTRFPPAIRSRSAAGSNATNHRAPPHMSSRSPGLPSPPQSPSMAPASISTTDTS